MEERVMIKLPSAERMHNLFQRHWESVARSRCWSVCMLIIVVGFVTFGWSNPQASWDVLGYTGSALQVAGVDDVHRDTYDIVQVSLQDEFTALVTDDPQRRASTYRSTMVHNSEAFLQQLPYYLIRPAYVVTIAMGYHWGVVDADAVLAAF